MATETVEPKKRLIATFMHFLTEELANESLSAYSKDSIEVAIQCLETAYEVNPVDGTLPVKKSILEIFSDYLKNNKEETVKKVISEQDKARADALKNDGNEFMKQGKFQEALDAYSAAIEIDDTNPIYFCNRAAAYSKLENHEKALENCRIAIKQDPSYSKAYCRMGLAYVSLNDHQRARDAYKKAVELDPSETNKNNYNLAEQKLKEQQNQFNSGFNLGNLLNNESLMNMATQMMSDPNMQNMLQNLVGNLSTQQAAAAETEGADGTAPPQGLADFMQAGQQIASQMQNACPDLVAQLKSALKKDGPPDDPNNPDNNPGQGGAST